jgi:hypothetical protein
MSNNLLSNGNDMAQITRDYLEWTNSHGITERAVEIWVQLYEKAWAEVKGSYNNIGNGGHCDDVWRALTGKNGTRTTITTSTPNLSADGVFQQIANAIGSGKVVCIGTSGIISPVATLPGYVSTDPRKNYNNLIGNHAYYVQSITSTHIVLCNPWDGGIDQIYLDINALNQVINVIYKLDLP